jgi:hypothetical protein
VSIPAYQHTFQKIRIFVVEALGLTIFLLAVASFALKEILPYVHEIVRLWHGG